MLDRAMQALYLIAMEPLSEITADHHSYGFRPMRSTADAIEQVFNACGKKPQRSGYWKAISGDVLITSAMNGYYPIFPWTGWSCGNG